MIIYSQWFRTYQLQTAKPYRETVGQPTQPTILLQYNKPVILFIKPIRSRVKINSICNIVRKCSEWIGLTKWGERLESLCRWPITCFALIININKIVITRCTLWKFKWNSSHFQWNNIIKPIDNNIMIEWWSLCEKVVLLSFIIQLRNYDKRYTAPFHRIFPATNYYYTGNRV